MRVASVRSDGPAARAGLREDDLLLAIDGVPVAGLSERDVHDKLAGEVGTTVVLTVERDGAPLELSVQRAPYGPRD